MTLFSNATGFVGKLMGILILITLSSNSYGETWSQSFGLDPYHSLEVDSGILDYVVTGVGVRAEGGRITTLRIQGREILENGELGPRRMFYFGRSPQHALEVWYEAGPYQVITGLGFRAVPGNVTTMDVEVSQYFDDSMEVEYLKRVRVGRDPNHSLEVYASTLDTTSDPRKTVLSGLGLREYNGKYDDDEALFSIVGLVSDDPL
ncbi:hypothetical protein [Pseudobacteriovorax antillogorgiicola]|uniref:Uncharacterized protein n=1 Tax=Pseudobacteriovorax antillogorgiicola TaxID=1513793 RepID=A0A1Y6CM44_9BACT|nr:hypothetical protein [Pseudobacteriovorax antillogorgiicola]TCS45676.1 hypothetical protein EDD56_12770 [Pseudobacteriovorax antillogorgiicola]SMF73130.1 hypothetical protein SAMN06296036_12769 [Pseudobacteriovorax antillogorgiicola]